MSEPVLFLHVPKTGGSSIEMTIALSGLIPSQGINYTFRSEHSEPPRFYFGHFRYGVTDGIEGRYATVVRDPVDLICSQYYFWQNAAKLQHKAGFHKRYDSVRRKMSLEEYVGIEEHSKTLDIDDGHIWPVAEGPRLMTFLFNGAEPKDFELIGNTHRLRCFPDKLHKMLNIDPIALRLDQAGHRPDGIVAAGKSYRGTLDAEMISRIELLCEEDMTTYEKFAPFAV